MNSEKEKMKRWNVTDNRFVVFLDIMGFKDMVMRNSHETIYNKMYELSEVYNLMPSLIENIDSFVDSNLHVTTFSDSIVIFSKNDSHQNLAKILSATKVILQYSLLKNIPLKGALAHGLTSVNKSKNIYFGQSIIDAYLLQEEVQYYGVVLHNTVEKIISIHKSKILLPPIFETKTFLKTGQITHLNIEWFEFLSKYPQDNDDLTDDQVFKRIITNLKQLTSGYPRKYIDNTEDMFKRFKELQPTFDININARKSLI